MDTIYHNQIATLNAVQACDEYEECNEKQVSIYIEGSSCIRNIKSCV